MDLSAMNKHSCYLINPEKKNLFSVSLPSLSLSVCFFCLSLSFPLFFFFFSLSLCSLYLMFSVLSPFLPLSSV
eukprot:m.102623 g.102623  ORF g.102623 m.102623 type:complete len:73 (-) comp22350_c0_seq4:1441-1659(-)